MRERRDLRDALRRAASALKANGPDFALAGSYALWVYGGPEPVHDVDLIVAETDIEMAVATLQNAGFTVQRTPEDWLFKVCVSSNVGDVFVIDVLHKLNGAPVDKRAIDNAECREVLAIPMRVLAATDVVTEKLRSLHEHYCDFATLLPGIRAVREQVDWDHVRTATAHNDFAQAFLTLTDRLGVTPN